MPTLAAVLLVRHKEQAVRQPGHILLYDHLRRRSGRCWGAGVLELSWRIHTGLRLKASGACILTRSCILHPHKMNVMQAECTRAAYLGGRGCPCCQQHPAQHAGLQRAEVALCIKAAATGAVGAVAVGSWGPRLGADKAAVQLWAVAICTPGHKRFSLHAPAAWVCCPALREDEGQAACSDAAGAYALSITSAQLASFRAAHAALHSAELAACRQTGAVAAAAAA